MNGTPAPEKAAADDCEHSYETRILGGQPLHVRLCQLCRTPDWVDLADQAAEQYRKGWEAGARDARPGRSDQPLAADIEIVAAGHTTEDTTAGSLILPNRLRINGQSVVTEGPVTIPTIALDSANCELVTANVTLVVRRLTIAAEGDIDGAKATRKSGTCDCGFEHGRPAEHDAPDRHPPRADSEDVSQLMGLATRALSKPMAEQFDREFPGDDCMGQCDPLTGGFTHRADCPVQLDPERTKATADATLADRMLVAQHEHQRAVAAHKASGKGNLEPGLTMFMLAAVEPELARLRAEAVR